MSQQRSISRVVNVPPPAPGFVGPGHLAAPVVTPEDSAVDHRGGRAAPARKILPNGVSAAEGSSAIAGWTARGILAGLALPAASHSRDLTDGQWVLIGPFLPKLARRKDGRGRPWRENRAVLNGILWILRTGAPWADLPDRYPSYQTCHRRFQQWVRSGVLKDILCLVAGALHDEGYLDVQEAFIDGTFAPAKKGGNCVGKTKRGPAGSH
jgi:transposase